MTFIQQLQADFDKNAIKLLPPDLIVAGQRIATHIPSFQIVLCQLEYDSSFYDKIATHFNGLTSIRCVQLAIPKHVKTAELVKSGNLLIRYMCDFKPMSDDLAHRWDILYRVED